MILLKKNQKLQKSIKYFSSKLLFVIGCFITFIGFTNCNGDDSENPLKCGNGSWYTLIEDELNAYVSAYTVYTNEPTIDNCAKYVNKGKNYIDALLNIEECVGTNYFNEYKIDLEDAREELENITCE